MKKVVLLVLISLAIGCDSSIRELPNGNTVKQIEQFRQTNDSLIHVIKSLHEKSNEGYWFDSSFDGREYLNAGISDPRREIIQTFRNDTSLIPIEAVLGGTMRFGRVELLSDRWLIAEFDDGHIYGKALFKYELRDSIFRFELIEHLQG